MTAYRELNRQGPDSGTQYRSTVFAQNSEQARVAHACIAQRDQAHVYGKRIATTVELQKPFFEAEAHHQDYLARSLIACCAAPVLNVRTPAR